MYICLGPLTHNSSQLILKRRQRRADAQLRNQAETRKRELFASRGRRPTPSRDPVASKGGRGARRRGVLELGGLVLGELPQQMREFGEQTGRQFRHLAEPGDGSSGRWALLAGQGSRFVSIHFPSLLGRATREKQVNGRGGAEQPFSTGSRGRPLHKLGVATAISWFAVQRASVPAFAAGAKPLRGRGLLTAKFTGTREGVPNRALGHLDMGRLSKRTAYRTSQNKTARPHNITGHGTNGEVRSMQIMKTDSSQHVHGRIALLLGAP